MGRSEGQGNTSGLSAKGHFLSLHLCPELCQAWSPSAEPGSDGSTGWSEELRITHTLCRTRVTEVKPCGGR